MSLIKQIFESHINNMSSVIRYTGTKTLHQENIAEHSYYVGIIADLIAEDLEINHKIEIDRYKVIKYAMYHDFEEIFTGDIITPVKNKSNEFKDALEKIAEMLVDEGLEEDFKGNNHITNNIKKYFTEYEEHKYEKIENQIVKFADQLEALMFSISEYKLGNSNFKEIIKNITLEIDNKWRNNKVLGIYIENINKITLDLI